MSRFGKGAKPIIALIILLLIFAFAFSLSAEIERNLISQRTKEAMARMKSEGLPVGRPAGSLSKKTKLTSKDETIKELLDKKVAVSTIGRIFRS